MSMVGTDQLWDWDWNWKRDERWDAGSWVAGLPSSVTKFSYVNATTLIQRAGYNCKPSINKWVTKWGLAVVARRHPGLIHQSSLSTDLSLSTYYVPALRSPFTPKKTCPWCLFSHHPPQKPRSPSKLFLSLSSCEDVGMFYPSWWLNLLCIMEKLNVPVI